MLERIASYDWMTPETERELGIEGLREKENLASLFEVASDGDGHRYYLSAVSRCFYVWWRFGPERIELCEPGDDNFIDWLVERYPEQPRGRPWATFEVSQQFDTTGFCYAHSTQFSLAELEAMASSLLSHPKIYRTSDTYSAIDLDIPLLFEVVHHHRGFHTLLILRVNRAAKNDSVLVEKILSFQKAILELGFCNPDCSELERAS